MEINNWNRNEERPVKLVMLGEYSVGKTSIATRFVKGVFNEDSYPTIGAAYMTKQFEVGDKKYKYELWDTAGQMRYRAITPLYYRNAEGALIVFDISKPDSFETVKYWYEQLKTELENINNIPISLVANKADLLDDKVENNQQEYETLNILSTAENFAKENGLGFFKASAKTGKGIVEAFEYLALNLPTKDETGPVNVVPVNLNQRETFENRIRDTCCQGG